MKRNTSERIILPKSPTGICGFDDLTGGGLPSGRPTLLCGGPGCGKTLFAVEYLVRGALVHDEPGVFMSFEESADEIASNVASLGFDLRRLVSRKKLVLDCVRISRHEIEETGSYDLEGLFIRLDHAISSVGARRVVLDSVEALFAGIPNHSILRSELQRLFRWLKDRGVTALITGERGESSLTRHGMEEYVSDCVILLEHRLTGQISTRWLRVVKYRGASHGTNEYPFLVDRDGICVWPVTSLKLDHKIHSGQLSTGIPRLDFMLGGKGYFRGSTILVSGMAGTGKTSMAASFVDAACRRGERCLYFAFEESPDQIVRNMRSIGINLRRWTAKNLLRFHAVRPTYCGLETHLAQAVKEIRSFEPRIAVLDPLSSLGFTTNTVDLKTTLMRLIDFLKHEGITAMLTNLTPGGSPQEHTESAVSSLIDTWLVLRCLEANGERNRCLHVLKSRGMAHSNQTREFLLTPKGIRLVDVPSGARGGVVGAARLAQEAREKADRLRRQEEVEKRRMDFERRRTAMQRQIEVLRSDLAAEEQEMRWTLAAERRRIAEETGTREALGRKRMADARKGIP